MMAFCDAEGQIYDHPDLEMVGWDGECWRSVSPEEVIPVPEGSDLFTLPARRPAGLDREPRAAGAGPGIPAPPPTAAGGGRALHPA